MAATDQMTVTATEPQRPGGGRRAARSLFVGLLLLLSAAALSCAVPEHSAEVVDPVLLRMGIYDIELSDFMLAARSRTAAGEFPRSGSGFEALRGRLLSELMVDTILLVEARSRELQVTDEQLAAELSARRQQEPPELSELALERELSERFGSMESYQEVVRRRMLLGDAEQRVRAELAAQLELSEAQLEAARDRLSETLVRPEQIRARQIFLSDRVSAARLHSELLAGANFEELALRHNGGNGDMGWMSLDSAPPQLAELVDGLQPGALAGPAQSSLGYHIFQLIERRPRQALSDDEARAAVERLLRDEFTELRFKAWLTERSEAFEVETDERAVERLRCCHLGLPYWGRPGAES
ncbi:MAG: hypothetical protein CMP23_01985 [Rickettsiales bacterium]|nr:hypothetical protein [Rickettsiales bacterium]